MTAPLSASAMMAKVIFRLMAERKRQGLSLATVAERCDVTAPAVDKWERGDSRPSMEHLFDWCAALGVPLVAGDGHKPAVYVAGEAA